MLEKFEVPKMSTSYGNIIKMMSSHPELIPYFLKIDVFKTLSSYVINSVFDISSEAMSVMEEILFSENKKVQAEVSNFLNSKSQEMMEIFFMFNQDNYLAKREGMKIIHELLLNKDQNKEFYNYFIQDKENLKFVMNSLNDESTAIQIEAFHLLLIILLAPGDKRGTRVNDTLKKNVSQLLGFIDIFMQDKEKEDENLEAKKKLAIKALKEIKT
uniref:Uncharacterized protein n=1 Tax=Euplotes harpa TaxID=151035 RepID=A0A7S3J2H7_9SPIT|mmetsp:Transcript_13114/g.15160  ORF Transcript_13114/g.15160 Transcript_13114/m.15160 type:complete len:214 (+) Transcript_13114:393-1034(+)